MSTWPPERIELLEKLWKDGLSASQIARQLGGVTRNAVIGVVHRRGLSGRAKPSKPARAPRAFALRPAKAPDRRAPPRPVAPPLPPKEPMPCGGGETALCASVEALGARMCRWPIGKPLDEFMGFCGRDRAGEGPYCATHAKRAYAPLKPNQPKTGNELARSLRRYV